MLDSDSWTVDKCSDSSSRDSRVPLNFWAFPLYWPILCRSIVYNIGRLACWNIQSGLTVRANIPNCTKLALMKLKSAPASGLCKRDILWDLITRPHRAWLGAEMHSKLVFLSARNHCCEVWKWVVLINIFITVFIYATYGVVRSSWVHCLHLQRTWTQIRWIWLQHCRTHAGVHETLDPDG